MPKFSYKFASLLLGLLLSWSVVASDQIAVNSNHPDRYVVVEGDTLWSISGRFLRDPWRWPDVWHVNPQINNPHLIFPGDIIVMTYMNGQPRLSLERGGTIKLSPRVRSTERLGAIPAIPVDAIQPFLSKPYVMDKETMNKAPYVVAFDDEHIVGSNDIKAYIRSIHDDGQRKFDVVRPGKAYKNADSGEVLGYEALYVGASRLARTGDPATVILSKMELETISGDRLIPIAEDTPMTAFLPVPPSQKVDGSIIDVLNGVTQIGQYNVVVLDQGADDGLEPGTVLAVDHLGETVRDKVSEDPRDTVRLPNEPAGMLMVFRTFPRVSFGLIMNATRAINILDRVRNP